MSFLENRDPQLVQPQGVPNLEKVDHEIQIIENSFPKRTMKILGILQIICGVLVIGLQVHMQISNMILKMANQNCYLL